MVLGAAAALVIRDVIVTVLHTGRYADPLEITGVTGPGDLIHLDWSDPRDEPESAA